MNSFKLLIIGNIGSGKSTVARRLSEALTCPTYGIDDARLEYGNGSPAGEARAWGAFLETAEHKESCLLECSGAGPFTNLLRLALERSGVPWAVVRVQTPVAECLARIEVRGLKVPYPSYDVPVEQVVPSVERLLERELAGRWPTPICEIDGTMPSEKEILRIVPSILGWLKGEF